MDNSKRMSIFSGTAEELGTDFIEETNKRQKLKALDIIVQSHTFLAIACTDNDADSALCGDGHGYVAMYKHLIEDIIPAMEKVFVKQGGAELMGKIIDIVKFPPNHQFGGLVNGKKQHDK